MNQYANILNNILKYGAIKQPAREGMPSTKSLFDCSIEVLDGSLPILYGKKVLTKNVISELLWFLKGNTNLSYLHKYNNHIWDDDAYRYYKELGGKLDFDEWLKECSKSKPIRICQNLKDNQYLINHYGDCGKIYGYQWRNRDSYSYEKDNHVYDKDGVDQIKLLITNLKNNPYSRYLIVDAWNWKDYVEHNQCLPACHTFFQCNVRPGKGDEKKLDISVWQRSCDMFLGVPYNLLSYGILHELLCKVTGYSKGYFKWHGGDCHIYENQIDAVNKYLEQFATLKGNYNKAKCIISDKPFYDTNYVFKILKGINNLNPEDIIIENYTPCDFIKAPLSTGINKWLNK